MRVQGPKVPALLAVLWGEGQPEPEALGGEGNEAEMLSNNEQTMS